MDDQEHSSLDECRACGSDKLISYLDLGDMPLVNRVLSKSEIVDEKKYKLEVLFCDDCNLSQLSVVVNPSLLFRDYAYRSSISDSFKRHCDLLSQSLNERLLNKGELVVDIASNDGCLLRPFKARGNKVLGVDPAMNLAEIASKSGIETIPEFWTPDLAREILKKHGPAKAITAFNVFAHVNDVHSFLDGVDVLLAKDGYFIIEAPHLYNLVEKNQFDTVYHEHLSYFLAKPIERMVRQHDLRLARIEKQNIHGGSLRYFIERKERNTSDGSVDEIMSEEEKAGLYHLGAYFSLKRQFEGVRNSLSTLLAELKSCDKKISAFGASAKGNILLNSSGLDNKTIDYIFDDTPEKQDKFYPGVHIPIISRDTLLDRMPDYLLLLSWNFSQEMILKTKDYQAKGGKYIIPIPFLKII
ncbi:MAG: methyltransferase domain-containing protein [Candidatus Nanoarchaeia archaeon]